MSKRVLFNSTTGLGVLGILLVFPMLAGCGDGRPGVRFGEDHDAGPENIQIHAPENRDKKMVALMALVAGQDFKKGKVAAINMGKMGHYAEPHLETLKSYSDHPDPEVSAAIKDAITKIEADLAKQAAGDGGSE
ncbi:MAG: hypothetical protein CMJ46_01515 [Planctomyces sp.]|nr:hypothetical protein [Planctomyces sp.]